MAAPLDVLKTLPQITAATARRVAANDPTPEDVQAVEAVRLAVLELKIQAGDTPTAPATIPVLSLVANGHHIEFTPSDFPTAKVRGSVYGTPEWQAIRSQMRNGATDQELVEEWGLTDDVVRYLRSGMGQY